MDANLVLKTRAAKVLLDEIEQNPTLLAQLQVFFTPYCDCDITQWIVSRIEANDSFVKAKIRELIAPMDNYPLLRGNFKPVAGQLLSQYCNGYDFVGIYADGNGGETQKVIEDNSITQGCAPPDALRFFYPLPTQRAALDAGSTNVVFASEPFYPYYNFEEPNQQLFFVKVFHSSIKTARLQVKVDGLTFGDYENLELIIGPPFGTSDGYYLEPNPVIIPYNTETNDWQHGTISVSFNPTTRIISIEHPWSGSDRFLLSDVDIVLRKANKVVGWFNLSYASEPYDPTSEAAQTPYDLMAIKFGSNN